LKEDDNLDSPPEIRKKSAPPSFPLELMDVNSAINNAGPTHHLSPGSTIYNVASTSPRQPSGSVDVNGNTEVLASQESYSYKLHPWMLPNDGGSLEFAPPRGELRSGSFRSRDVTITSSSKKRTNQQSLRNHPKPSLLHDPSKKQKSDVCVTPSPATQVIRQAVSDESNSPPTIHVPSTVTSHDRSNPAFHHVVATTPSSNTSGLGAPYPPSTYSSNSTWSDSLHMAPLPPFVSHALPPTAHQCPPPAWNLRGFHQYPPYQPSMQQHQPNPDEHFSASGVQPSPSANNTSNEATNWRQKQLLLSHFKARFGNCNVPPGYGVGTEYEGLHNWLVDQQYQHQRMVRGESSAMTPTRARILTSMGFVFYPIIDHQRGLDSSDRAITSNNNTSWQTWIELLREYKSKFGDVDVPLKYEENPSLGNFVNKQRCEYRKMTSGKPSSMTSEKILELNKLGFTWVMRESYTPWDDRYEVSYACISMHYIASYILTPYIHPFAGAERIQT
jgi:hypothetical protein